MHLDQDWDALLDSEIFREYMKNELRREASEKAQYEASKYDRIEKDLDDQIAAHEALEKAANDEKLKEYLTKCVAALEANPELKNKIDKKFIAALELAKEAGLV